MIKSEKKSVNIQSQLDRKRDFAIKDLAYTLIFAFVSMQVLSFFLLADKKDVLGPGAVGSEKLVLQIIVFLAVFLMGLTIYFLYPKVKLWPITSSLIGGHLLTLCLLSNELVFTLACLVIDLCLIWTIGRQTIYRERRLDLQEKVSIGLLACFASIKLFVAIHNIFAKNFVAHRDSGLERLLLLALISIGLGLLSAHIYKIIQELNTKGLLFSNKNLIINKALALVLLILGLYISLVMLGRIMVYRVWTFSTPTYDFGLFNQMFEYMKETGMPLTTLERDGLYSHFQVHFAPIFYLYLPIYALIPRPETLQLLQLLTVASGIIPLIAITRHFDFSPLEQAAFACLYLVQPGILLSSCYDLHENCFYAPLVIWLFYGIFTKKHYLVLIIAGLTLLVKEDAPLYVVSAGLFLFFSPQTWLHNKNAGLSKQNKQDLKAKILGLCLILMAVVYFALVSNYLSQAGDGLMTYRFEALDQYNKKSFFGLVRSLFQNPARVLAVAFSEEKFSYLIIMTFSVGLLGFWQRHSSHYLLFLPLLIMNLATFYPYQYQIDFQYGYGSFSFLIISALLAYLAFKQKNPVSKEKSFSINQKKIPVFLLSLCLIVSLLFSLATLTDMSFFKDTYQLQPEKYQEISQSLASLPKDKIIAADTFYTTHLAHFPDLYDLEYNSSIEAGREIDLLVINREHISEKINKIKSYYQSQGFVVAQEYSSQYIEVLVRPGF